MSSSKFRILYVEDDADTRDLVSLVLTMSKCEVTVTDNKDSALTHAGTGKFHLYLIDNWLKGTSGIELCRELRLLDPLTPILFYSGAAFDGDKEKAFASGAQGYLTKPSTNDELVGEVFRLINLAKTS